MRLRSNGWVVIVVVVVVEWMAIGGAIQVLRSTGSARAVRTMTMTRRRLRERAHAVRRLGDLGLQVRRMPASVKLHSTVKKIRSEHPSGLLHASTTSNYAVD